MHVDQPVHDGADAGHQRRLVQPSIGEGRVIGGVDIARIGPQPRDFTEDREAAQAGIEDEDRWRAHGEDRAPLIDRSREKIDAHDTCHVRPAIARPARM